VSGLRACWLPGSRYQAADMAPSGLLPAPDVPGRPRATGDVSDVWVHQVAVPWAREGPGFTAPFKRSEGEAISQVLAVHCEIASSPSLRSGSSQ